MKLSDLKPEEIEVVQQPGVLKLSTLDPSDVETAHAETPPPDPGFSADPYDWGATAPTVDEKQIKEFSENAPQNALNYAGMLAPAGKAGMAVVGGAQGAIQPAQSVRDRVKNTIAGAVGGLTIGAAMPYVGKAAGKAASFLGGKAGDLMEAATGATAAEKAKFRPGTGRFLLDNGIGKFGSSPEGIASRARAMMDAAEASKSDIVKNQLSGVNVSRNKVYNSIRDKINELRGNESQKDLVRALESRLDDIAETGADHSEIPLPLSEEIRRGFDEAFDKSASSAANKADKIVAGVYRNAGEQAALEASPELGAKFKADKTTQSILIPVEKAASRRASVLNQSPRGGLHDTLAAGTGAVFGGPAGAAGAVAAKRVLLPRLASAEAVSADQLSKLFAASPELFGKFQPILAEAAARGGAALATTLNVLKRDPSFIQQLSDTNSAGPGVDRKPAAR